MFKYPVKGARLTSPFGKDVLNGKERFHNGIDLAKSGTVNVMAAADGVVSKSYTSDSYGEVVFIRHLIDNKQYETVYAHLRKGSRRVSVGERVKQGQVIGIMGNTGFSLGQHLHFELHEGTWNLQKSNAVDPLPYLDQVKQTSSKKQYLNLKPHMDKWAVYKTNVKPVSKNRFTDLRPKKFKGLSYEILANPLPNVYTIQTQQFGKVNIYAPNDPDSSITDKPLY